MENPICPNSELNIIGIVAFKGETKGGNHIKLMGHYTALVKRGGNWFEYDDIFCTTIARKKTFKVIPQFIFK